LQLGAGGTLNNQANFDNSGSFINAGTLINHGTFGNATSLTNTGTIMNDGTFGGHGMLTNAGIFTNEAGGTLLGNITNNGSLIFSAEDTTYSGVISGAGSLRQEGASTLILSGSNTYTGATLIAGGTLMAGAADAFSQASATGVAVGGVLDLGGSAQSIDTVELNGGTIQNGTLTSANGIASTGGTIDGLRGTAALTINAGTTALLGSNSFAGGADVAGGTLDVGNAANPGTVLDGDVTVAPGGLLDGHGAIYGNVADNGVVSLGGSIGILTVRGNYTQNSGGTLNIEVTQSTVAGTGYDQLQVTGRASPAGALDVQVDGGTYSVGSQYDILQAAGNVSGRFPWWPLECQRQQRPGRCQRETRQRRHSLR
jgi:autotransporter-associated beta strand protein